MSSVLRALAAVSMSLALAAGGAAQDVVDDDVMPHTMTIAEDVAVILKADGESHSFNIEIADTPEETSRGLMFREELAPDAGMLFDFLSERPVSFWMQNTLIPLDMLFIRADGEIVRVHAEAVPMDRTPIPSGEPVRFVLEIPGGRAAELGIAAGDRLEHPRVEGAPD